MTQLDLQSWIRGLPKAELHVHLEGAVSPEILLHFSYKYFLDLPPTIEELRNLFEFTDFSHFLKVYLLISTCLRSQEDLHLVTKSHLKKAAEQGILYSEVEWTPNTLALNGISYRDQVDGLISGIREGEKEYGVTLRLIPDVIPGEGVDAAMVLLDEIEEHSREEVIGFGIGGPEIDYILEDFRGVYRRASSLGLSTTAHAGETAGPEAVWEAILNLKADRIGHGVHSIRDERLLDTLQEKQIPLDVCPTSNLKINYFASYETHPIRKFFDSGIPISLNSDDPALFNQDLAAEYQNMATRDIFSLGELKQLAANSFRYSFLPNGLKERYLKKVEEYPSFSYERP